MRFFEKYIPGKRHIQESLLWDYDIPQDKLNNYPRLIATRVIKFGRLEDFYAAFDLFGGIDSFAKIAKEQVTALTPKELNFICCAFGFKKEEKKCYKKEQLRKKRLNS